ncbi:MAG: hypothetical protein JW888_10390 [Pirellulales bacterium]|nr:hypothetical protein [Pirellulales bacterium]
MANRPAAVVHITDLFRPHDDPDDHWDLATQYALAARGDTRLVAVLIDGPRRNRAKDPDILAVAQLNHITGLSVPALAGAPDTFPFDADMKDPAVRNSIELAGIRALHRLLRESPDPVVITVTGWCRDLIILSRFDPELFAEKCAGVYLNAGLGAPDPAEQTKMNWNVALDPPSYIESFSLRIPIYWLPCYHAPGCVRLGPDARYGSLYEFRQGEVLRELSDPMRNYFLSMFRDGGKGPGRADWLTTLYQKPDEELLEPEAKRTRRMWCTAGMLHMVGKTVLPDGTIAPLDKAGEREVYAFRPIRVKCDRLGRTSWTFGEPAKAEADRFIFEVRDTENYRDAMGKALRCLILELGTRER